MNREDYEDKARMSFNLSILECKCFEWGAPQQFVQVLIYPYWNVNDISFHSAAFSSCFNLSILECKYCIRVACCVHFTVLIYPYWNVNLLSRCVKRDDVAF